MGALAPLLRETLALSREQIGWLTAFFYAGTALACLPSGWVADHRGVRCSLIAAQLLGGSILAMPLLRPTYNVLLLVMFLVGLTYGTITVITTKAICDWFPRTRRATALGMRIAALPLSGTLASAVMPLVALWRGWSPTFALLGGLMVASGLGALLFYFDPGHEGQPAASQIAVARRRSIFLDYNIWLLAAVGFFFGGVKSTFATYLALFLHESWGLERVHAARMLALAHLVSIPSYALYGLVSDRWLNGASKGLLYGIGTVATAALLALLLLPLGTPPLVLLAFIVLVGFTGLSWGTMYQTLTAEVAGPAAVGVGVGITVSCLYAGSTATAPLFGRVADVTGSYRSSWGLLVLWMVLGIGCLAGVRIALRRQSEEPASRSHTLDSV